MNQDDKNAEICKNCNLPKGSEGQGSLTQWILTCSCDRNIDEVSQEDVVNICQSCGKKVQLDRKGSFTQWIFRPDLCECENPVIETKYNPEEIIGAEDEFTISESDQIDKMGEPGLSLSPQEFPVDRFKPLAKLGQGISSIAYLCVDKLLNKKVVIKCLLNLNEDTAIRFQNEARLITKLHHENIVSVRDIGLTESSIPYMVLDHFNGISLSEYISNKTSISDYEVLEIAKQLSRGLGYAHSKGIFHRDIKPSNILIAENSDGVPNIKVIDFGSAFLKTDNHATDSKIIEGTPLYMPPDQPAGLDFNARSEVYSLGCLIFELLCKQTPFTGNSAIEILRKHAEAPIPSLKEFETSSNLVNEFDSFISKCLAKDSNDRYASMSEVENALNEIEAEADTEEDQINASTEEKSISPSSNKRLMVLSAISILALFSIGILCFLNVLPPNKNIAKQPLVEPDNEPPQKRAKKKLFQKSPKNYTIPKTLDSFKDEDLKYLPRRTKRLDLVGQFINGSGFKYLKRKRVRLTHLRLNYTDVSDKSLAYLRGMKSLKYLSLSMTGVSTKGIKNLGDHNLTHLYLINCPNIDDDSIGAIVEQFPTLLKCSLGNRKITTNGIKKLKKLNEFVELRLKSQAINDDTVDVLVDLELKELALMNAPISDKGLLKFKNSKKMVMLVIENCHSVTAEGVKALEKLRPDLKVSRIFIDEQRTFPK